MKTTAAIGLSLATATVAMAGPEIDAFRAGRDSELKTLAATATITGTISDTFTTAEGAWGRITKAAGSISSSANLLDLAPDLGLNATVILTGTEVGASTLRWAVTAPSAIGQTVTVTVGTTTANIKITAVSGTLTADLAFLPVELDPFSGTYRRNVKLTPNSAGPNSMVIRGLINGLPFLPVTTTINQLDYIGRGAEAVGSFVKGNVLREGIVANPYTQTVTVDVLDASNQLVQSASSPIAANGDYIVNVDHNGTFNLRARVDHFLSDKHDSVALNAAVVTQDFQVLNGDINLDNTVDLQDYLSLVGAFDATPADASWLLYADLNHDLVVDLSDYLLLVANFEQSGS